MDAEVITDHIAQIDRVQDLACEYWLREAAIPGRAEELEALLKGAFTASSHFEQAASPTLGFRLDRYRELDLALFQLATGGTFETSQKNVDHERAIAIVDRCNELKALLRAARRSIFWVR